MLSSYTAIAVGLAVAVCFVVAIAFVVFQMRRRLQQHNSPVGDASGANNDTAFQEMEWDHSTLNITLNPLDIESCFEDDEINLVGCRFQSLDRTDANDGLTPEEVDEKPTSRPIDEKPDAKELEWDDSTLTY